MAREVKPKANFDYLLKALPPAFSRQKVEEYLPGVIKAKTLANLESLGQGPPCFKSGRHVSYVREDFLNWLANRN